MVVQSKFINLFGQIRIYSLVDLLFFSIALRVTLFQIAGIIFLHLGFLLYLEFVHKHEFRMAFPKYLWAILLLIGIIFYNNLAVVGFLICSYFYVKKHLPKFGWSGPVSRGFQYYFLAAGIVGFFSPISFLIGGLLIVRNFAGDLRDVVKDRKEGLQTLPIIFGISRNYKSIHLITMLVTTAVWWYLSGVSILWLIPVFIIQIGSYNLTPR